MSDELTHYMEACSRLRERAEQAERALAEKGDAWQQEMFASYERELATLRSTLARVEGERDDAENKADNLRSAWDREHAVLTAERDGLRAALEDAPDMTCESPEARAWREKHAAALGRPASSS